MKKENKVVMRTSYFKDIARSFQEGGSTFNGVGGKGQIIDGQYVEDFESGGPDPWRYRMNYTKKTWEVMDTRNPSRGWITLDGSTQKLKRAQKAVEDRFGSAKRAMDWFEKNGKEQSAKNDATPTAPPQTPREPISIDQLPPPIGMPPMPTQPPAVQIPRSPISVDQLPGRPMGPIGYERPPIQPPVGPRSMPPYSPPIEDLPQDGGITEEDYRSIDEEMRRILEQDRINAERALNRPYVDPPQRIGGITLSPIEYQRPPINVPNPKPMPPYSPPIEDQEEPTISPEAAEMIRQIKIDAGLIPTVTSSGPYTVTSRVGKKNQSQNNNVSLLSDTSYDSDTVTLVRDKDGKAFIGLGGYFVPYVKGDNWLGGSDYVGKYFDSKDSNEDILKQLEREVGTNLEKKRYKGGRGEYLTDLFYRKSGSGRMGDGKYSSRISEEDFYNDNYDLSNRFTLLDPYTYPQGFRQGGYLSYPFSNYLRAEGGPPDLFRQTTESLPYEVASTFDPTGISGIPGAYYAAKDLINDPSMSNAANFGINALGAIPGVTYLGKGMKAAKLGRNLFRAVNAAENIGLAQSAYNSLENKYKNYQRPMNTPPQQVSRDSAMPNNRPVFDRYGRLIRN